MNQSNIISPELLDERKNIARQGGGEARINAQHQKVS